MNLVLLLPLFHLLTDNHYYCYYCHYCHYMRGQKLAGSFLGGVFDKYTSYLLPACWNIAEYYISNHFCCNYAYNCDIFGSHLNLYCRYLSIQFYLHHVQIATSHSSVWHGRFFFFSPLSFTLMFPRLLPSFRFHSGGHRSGKTASISQTFWIDSETEEGGTGQERRESHLGPHQFAHLLLQPFSAMRTLISSSRTEIQSFKCSQSRRP